MKALPAIIFALGMTAVVAVAMFFIGANALVNPNSVPVVNAQSTGAGTVQSASYTTDQQQQVAQMQQLVAQYQAREKQYQAELNDAAQRLTQANQQVQAYQQILQRLQEIGLIRVDQNGQIFLGRRGGGDGD